MKVHDVINKELNRLRVIGRSGETHVRIAEELDFISNILLAVSEDMNDWVLHERRSTQSKS